MDQLHITKYFNNMQIASYYHSWMITALNYPQIAYAYCYCLIGHDKGLKAEPLKHTQILNADVHVVKPLSTKVLRVRVVLMNK